MVGASLDKRTGRYALFHIIGTVPREFRSSLVLELAFAKSYTTEAGQCTADNTSVASGRCPSNQEGKATLVSSRMCGDGL